MLISCVLMDSMCNIRQVNHSGFSSVIKLQTYVTEWQKGVEMRLPVLTLELPVWFSICRTPIMAPRLKNHSLDLVCPSVPYWDSNSRVSQTAGSRCWGSSCGDGFVLIFPMCVPIPWQDDILAEDIRLCVASLMQEQLIMLPPRSRDISPLELIYCPSSAQLLSVSSGPVWSIEWHGDVDVDLWKA